MKTINFFGGPGVGKSTIAAGLFYAMKAQGMQAELVTEYAKDVTWEGRHQLLNDQLYLLAKQNRRLARLLDHKVDYAITDSPLLLGAAYTRLGESKSEHMVPLIFEFFNSYDNINIVIERDPSFYVQVGRSQTLDQASVIDNVVLAMLAEFNIPYTTIKLGTDPDEIQKLLELVV